LTSEDGHIVNIDLRSGLKTSIAFKAHIDKPLGPLVRFSYPLADAFQVRAIRNPQISPDGHRLVFAAIDRLWIMNLPIAHSFEHTSVTHASRSNVQIADDDQPRRLTTDEIGEFFPSWSPDGRSIAYCTWSDNKGGAVNVIDSSGHGPPIRLTTDGAFYEKALYGPDGQHVYAVRGWPDGFRSAAFSGLGQLQIVDVPLHGTVMAIGEYLAHSSAPSWTSKTSALVYSQPHLIDGGARIAFYDPDDGVVTIRATGAGRRSLIRQITIQSSGSGDSEKPTEVLLSPSGRHALILSPTTSQPLLTTIPGEPRINPPTLALTRPGLTRTDAAAMALFPSEADFIGWTSAGVPYFSVGNVLFIADRSPDFLSAEPLPFHQIAIHLKVPRDRATGTLILRGARVLTLAATADEKENHSRATQPPFTGNKTFEPADLLIRDGRIATIAEPGQLHAENATVFDVSGKFIIPGYLDVHDHVGTDVSFGVHTTQEPRLMVELAFGVTTLRDPYPHTIDLMALGERIDAGDLLGPRVFTVNGALVPELFEGDDRIFEVADVRKALAAWADYYGSETIKQYLAGGRRMRQLIAMAAREAHLTPTNEGAYNTALDLSLVLDGYSAFEHPLPPAPIYQDVVQLLARSGTIPDPVLATHFRFRHIIDEIWPWSTKKMKAFLPPQWTDPERQTTFLTHNFLFPYDEATVKRVSSQATKVMEAGGCVSMGSHGNAPGIGAHWEIWTLKMGGMSAYNSLRAATLCGALAIGHERDLGSLEVGKLADLQILDRDPLEDIHNTLSIHWVMKTGRLFNADSLDEVWPQPQSRDLPWWVTP